MVCVRLIRHACIVQVDAPIDKVYKIWSNRLNYNEWFDLIGQVGSPSFSQKTCCSNTNLINLLEAPSAWQWDIFSQSIGVCRLQKST